jgi:probable rRNA maturation factor
MGLAQIEICNRQDAVECPKAEIADVVRCALDQEEHDAVLSIVLVGDQEMVSLNKRFLGRSTVTDVLAFPYGHDGSGLNGEIIVNADLAVRQAGGRPHTAVDELLLYVVHGLLHLLGYDDHEEAETRRMRQREQDVLKAAGRTVSF